MVLFGDDLYSSTGAKLRNGGGRSGGGGGLLLAGLAVGGYFLFTKVIRPQVVVPLKMKNYVERLRLGKINGFKIKKDTIEFKFPVENPNNGPMVVKAIVGDVYVSDNKGQRIKLGTINHFGTDNIKPLGSTEFDLVVKIKAVSEFLYLSKIYAGKWIGQNFSFVGTVNANNRPWPINETVKIA